MYASEPINNKDIFDIVILGGGVAGLAAAITGGSLGLKILLLEKAVFGGSFAVLESVTGYPGIEKIDGWDLTQTMVKQAKVGGCKLLDSIEAVDLLAVGGGIFQIKCSDANQFRTRSVIITTGGQPRMLGLAEETHFAQHGIHTCVQCAGTRYKGKTVAIAGNSSWAARAAEHLLNLGCTVIYTTKDTELRGDANIVKELLSRDQFRFLGGYHITGLYGKESLEEILVTGLTGGNFQKIKVPAVFVYRGIKPNSSIAPVSKDRRGFLQVDENFMTSLPGVYGAGRVVQDDLPIQVMVGDAGRAALAAAAFIQLKA